jgi:hypothetical protein
MTCKNITAKLNFLFWNFDDGNSTHIGEKRGFEIDLLLLYRCRKTARKFVQKAQKSFA